MFNEKTWRTVIAVGAAVAISLSAGACKVVKNEPKEEKQDGKLEIFFVDEKFNPDKIVAEIWDTKVLPFADENAIDLMTVLTALSVNAAATGEKYGHREKPEGSPWNYVVKGDAKIVEVNTESRASTIGLDIAPHDGVKDVLLQIGPVIKGTSIRDSLDFVKFDDFTNQLEFARLSNALNKQINTTFLSKLSRDALLGKSVSFMGMFTDPGKKKEVLITPVRLSVGEGG